LSHPYIFLYKFLIVVYSIDLLPAYSPFHANLQINELLLMEQSNSFKQSYYATKFASGDKCVIFIFA